MTQKSPPLRLYNTLGGVMQTKQKCHLLSNFSIPIHRQGNEQSVKTPPKLAIFHCVHR